jgi:prephenate dehydrogenase
VRSDQAVYFSSVVGTNAIIATKQGAIVGGQTSCKAPEIAAFEKHLPEDVDIVSCHSLHGPNVDPKGQPLVSNTRINRVLLLDIAALGSDQTSCITREL